MLIGDVMPGVPMAGIDMPVRSIIMLVIYSTPLGM
jgi:hypothetical protein